MYAIYLFYGYLLLIHNFLFLIIRNEKVIFIFINTHIIVIIYKKRIT